MVQVTLFVLLPVVRSSFEPVIEIAFTKSLPPAPTIVPVIMILPVAHHARPVITKVLGLLVVNQVGYVSVIVRSPASGPLFP